MTDAIQLSFLGAFAGVTGSKSLLEWSGQKILIDCGLFQGPPEVRRENWTDLSVAASSIDSVLLTHAHLDHVGYLPRLYRQGFRGPIYCSAGTQDLAQIILLDSAHLEEETAKYAQAHRYSHHEDPQPLFTIEETQAVLELLKPIPRYEWLEIGEGIELRFLRAGHIIGSCMIQVRVGTPEKSRTFTFSGDVGHDRSMILKKPDKLEDTDILVLESTYGNRLHDRSSANQSLGTFLKRAIDRQGVVVIPAFAVGRSQELLYMIAQLEREGVIPSVPVIIDSPMSKKALDIYFAHPEDQSENSSFRKKSEGFLPRYFEAASTADESMLVTMMDGPAIIISASGMLSGGRILHHLKHRLPNANNMVIFSGYQAEGSKGRFLQDNASTLKFLRIHHREVAVRAEIVTIDNLSAHADYEQMLAWMSASRIHPSQVLLNHGDIASQKSWALRIRERLGWSAVPTFENRFWTFQL